jgi:hypothetical protein
MYELEDAYLQVQLEIRRVVFEVVVVGDLIVHWRGEERVRDER